MSNNLLLTDKLVKELYAEVAVVSLYAAERSVPKGLLLLQRASRMGQLSSTTPSTLFFLGRVLQAGALAYGYLQIARPQTDVFAMQTISVLKSLSLSSGNYLAARAKPNLDVNPGVLQITLTQAANDALKRIETYDPAFSFLEAAVNTVDSTRRVFVRGSGYNPTTSLTSGVLEIDPIQDYVIVADGITFPSEVLF